MSGGSDSANETWKPWPGWKSEPAACMLRTTTRIATGSRAAAEANFGGWRSRNQISPPVEELGGLFAVDKRAG